MQRAIIGFEQDEEGVWVAQLACGHRQHVRHQPPFQDRAWVTTPEGRATMRGTNLDCPFCNMAALPEGAAFYKRTPSFTELSIPAALLRDHQTKAGVWAQILVEEGRLEYSCDQGVFVLRPGVVGIVEPERPHSVRPLGSVRFHVRFLRC